MTDTQAPPRIFVDSWMDGVPLFILTKDRQNFTDELAEHGCWVVFNEGEEPQQMFPQIYYLVAEEVVTQETKSATGVITKTTSRSNGIYKVIKNLVGSAITRVGEETVGLGEVKQQAYFTLPSIPWSLINDLDDFFRYVYQKEGTESIVIFTYDMAYENAKEPSEGWGFLVPDQTNSAASCDYEPESVVEELPDDKDIRLVGTAHSHPGMSAFCSGTDKRDQSQFDGIHITFGWKRGSDETDFYVELQMGGGQFIFNAEDIFKDMPAKEYSEKIKQLSGKVKKASTGQGTRSAGAGMTTGGESHWYNDWWNQPDAAKYQNLPKGCPTPNKVALVVAPLLTESQLDDCPVCDKALTKREQEVYKCLRCQTFIRPVEMETLNELVKARADVGMKSYEIDLEGEHKPHKPVWLWEEIVDEKTGEILDVVRELFEGKTPYKVNKTEDHASKK